MGLIDGLHNVPERFKRCCSSLAPSPTNNNNAYQCGEQNYAQQLLFCDVTWGQRSNERTSTVFCAA